MSIFKPKNNLTANFLKYNKIKMYLIMKERKKREKRKEKKGHKLN